MKAEEMLKIFEFEDIKIDVINDHKFEEPHDDQYEDFEKLECRDGVWSLILEIHERRRGEEIEKSFKNKEEAIRYFCFYKLQDKYFDRYLDEVIHKNHNIIEDDFTVEELIAVFDELGIEDDLYGFNSYKKNALNMIDEQNGSYVIVFLDGQKNIILKTRKLDRTESLFFMFEMVYLTHIMKTHAAQMQKKGLLADGVTAEDYKVLLA